MQLPDEILEGATSLGQCLNETSAIKEYQKAAQEVQNDADAAALEEKFNTLYSKLASMEQTGHPLEQEELDQYYHLRNLVRGNLLISTREDQLQLVKFIFAEAGKTMASVLGIDFSILAL